MDHHHKHDHFCCFDIYTILLGILAIWMLLTFAREQGFLPKKNISGKHVFLTGGGNGLGQQLIKEFVQLGCKVTFVDIDVKGLQKTESMVQDLKIEGSKTQHFQLNVMDREAIRKVAKDCQKKFGGVDILVNNAGVVQGKDFFDSDEKVTSRCMVINAECHFWFAREFLPHMMKQNWGQIVSIASVAGLGGGTSMTDYCMSKFAAVGFMESLRLEMKKSGKNIKCLTICPIFFDSGMFAGVSGSTLMPILTLKEVIWRTMTAIKQDEEHVIIPWNIGVAHYMSKFLYPTWFFDKVNKFFTSWDSMNGYKGRENNGVYQDIQKKNK